MKRIFSKKSGFTLVEIIVAFAIFAIMSTMILSMVQLTVKQRNMNAQFEENLTDDNMYLAGHYIGDSDKYDAAEISEGEFNLQFPDQDVKISLDYQMRGNPDYSNDAGGVNYFVGNVNYNDPEGGGGGGGGDAVEGFGNQQDSRYTTWLTGTKGIDKIVIEEVIKDTSYSGSGCRYFIKCMASGGNVDEDYKRYSQYRISFKLPTTVEVSRTDGSGNTKKYKVHENATIVNYGYLNSYDYEWNPATCVDSTMFLPDSSDVHNRYIVEQTSTNTLHFTCPYRVTGYALTTSSKIWVEFAEDITLNKDSFGSNGVDNGASVSYSQYPGEYTDNIFGAFDLVEVT